MCGFVGIHRFDGAPIDARQLTALASTMTHRGPDGAGVWVGARAGLAHRRLAIIDPAGSPQPMTSAGGTLHIAFNGEILNYRDLRRRVRGPFRTNGDTEILLALHEANGPSAARRLRGQFAYAVHDDATSETWLVRDRLGILPLYYVQRPGWIAFASEAKALLPLLPAVEVDPESLDAYLTHRSVPAPHTLFAGVRKLPPGHVGHVGADGRLTISPYWTLDTAPTRQRIDDRDAIALVERHLRDAVADALVADVPVGAYLSGGLDSSLVASFAADAVAPGTLHTFSAGFTQARTDELPFARDVSAALGTVHHEVVVRPADLGELWETLTWHRDAPLSEPADVAVHLLAKEAASHVKVVLSGEGADEVFGGYPKHRFARATGMPWPVAARAGFELLQRGAPPTLRRARVAMRALSAPSVDERIEAWFAPFTGRERAALIGRRRARPALARPNGGGDPLTRMLAADCGAWLADNLLERGDRMTMAASVELRPPFLDHRLVALGFSLPGRVKVRDGSGKWVLRRVADHRLPAGIVRRPKAGFPVPLDEWFRGDLRDTAHDLLMSPGSFVGQVFDRRAVAQLLARHDRRRADEDIRIWTLVSLEVWHGVAIGSRHHVREAVPA